MSWITGMNRCTGPEPCHCPITGAHDPSYGPCPRNVALARRRAEFDAKVRTHGYVDRVTGERIHDPDALGVPVLHAPGARIGSAEELQAAIERGEAATFSISPNGVAIPQTTKENERG